MPIRNTPTLTARLTRLPLHEQQAIGEHFGITELPRAKGNLADWPYSSQLHHAICGGDNDRHRYAELNAVLQSVENRLGLSSPKFYPWPLKIELDITYTIESDQQHGHYLITSPHDIPGLFHCNRGDETFEEFWNDSVQLVKEMLLFTHGLEIDAIEAADGPHYADFKALEVVPDKFIIEYSSREVWQRAITAHELAPEAYREALTKPDIESALLFYTAALGLNTADPTPGEIFQAQQVMKTTMHEDLFTAVNKMLDEWDAGGIGNDRFGIRKAMNRPCKHPPEVEAEIKDVVLQIEAEAGEGKNE